jgi:hypothetical protein
MLAGAQIPGRVMIARQALAQETKVPRNNDRKGKGRFSRVKTYVRNYTLRNKIRTFKVGG